MISVKETAIAFGTSHTPVREALERLAGEGVIHPGKGRQGFTIARYGARDLSDLHGLLDTLLTAALAGRTKIRVDPSPLTEAARSDPAGAVDDTIGYAASGSRNRMVSGAILRTSIMLAPYRLFEPMVLPGWLDDLNRLRAGLATGQGATRVLHSFTRLRTSHASRLVDALEASSDIRDIYQV